MRATASYYTNSILITSHATDGPSVEKQQQDYDPEDDFAGLTNVTIAPQILLAIWATLAVAGLFIALKLLARLRKRLRWWWDDYIMLLSWLCLGTGSISLTTATKHGLGRHIEFLDDEARHNIVQFGTIAAALTVAASVWSKVSYAFFLLRISSSGCTEGTRNWILGIIISLNMMLPVVLATFFINCSPVEKELET